MHFLRLYGRVLALLAPDRWVAIGLGCAAFALAGLSFLEPVLFGRVVDLLSRSDRLPPEVVNRIAAAPPTSEAHSALKYAIITPLDKAPPATLDKLSLLLQKYR